MFLVPYLLVNFEISPFQNFWSI